MKNNVSTKKSHRLLLGLVASVLLAVSGTTSATILTMTFNDGPLVNQTQSYTENGVTVIGDIANPDSVFSITDKIGSDGDFGSDGNFEMWSSGSCGPSFGFPSCAYIFSTGDYFDLISIDLVFDTGNADDFIASSGASVVVPVSPTRLDFTGLSGWTDITSFTWQARRGGYIDNIVLRTHEKVPEPAPIALMGIVFAGLGITRRWWYLKN